MFVWTFSTGTCGSPQAATPTFSPARPAHTPARNRSPFPIPAPGTQIYYTTDGSTPTTASTVIQRADSGLDHHDHQGDRGWRGLDHQRRGQRYIYNSNSTTPAAPSSLSATPFSATQVNLSWTDNSSNETAFLLERKTGSGGTYAQIASIAANTVSYSDNTVTASTTYFYRIRATNANGNSAYSNEATATTPGADSCAIALV